MNLDCGQIEFGKSAVSYFFIRIPVENIFLNVTVFASLRATSAVRALIASLRTAYGTTSESDRATIELLPWPLEILRVVFLSFLSFPTEGQRGITGSDTTVSVV